MLDNEFPPLGGGMGTVNHALLKQYASEPGLEIDLITSALGSRRQLEQFSNKIRIIKVPVWNRNIHHSTVRELLFYAIQAALEAFKLHREHPYDLCVAWSTVPAGVLALMLERVFSLPYVVWVSGPDIPGFEQRYRYIYPFLTPLIRWVWTCAGRVIAKCGGEIDMIRSVHNKVAIEFIPNGVDVTQFQPNTECIPATGPLHVVCVARLIERKGQNHLIEAIKIISDAGVKINVSLIGDGDARAEYESQARNLGIHEQVQFIGYVPREQIANYYRTGHIFVLPSYNEGMALAVLEAMAAGLPVIVTNTGGTSELVDHGINGFIFDWADVKSLAHCLLKLNSDRALARSMAVASRSRAITFSWELIAGRFLNLFYKQTQSLPVDTTKSYA